MGRGEWSAVAMPFVGRSTERAALNRAWQSARNGQGRVIGLTGGSGMGKTALLHRFLSEANPRFRVVVNGDQAERSEAWGVLGHMAAALSAFTGRSGGWADPDVAAHPVHIGKPFLDEIRAVGQIILAIDDMQWADRQSQEVLGYVARRVVRLPVLMIVIYNIDFSIDGNWLGLFQPP